MSKVFINKTLIVFQIVAFFLLIMLGVYLFAVSFLPLTSWCPPPTILPQPVPLQQAHPEPAHNWVSSLAVQAALGEADRGAAGRVSGHGNGKPCSLSANPLAPTNRRRLCALGRRHRSFARLHYSSAIDSGAPSLRPATTRSVLSSPGSRSTTIESR